IEDDPRLGPRLKRNLELSGYRVSLASNGRSGLNSAMNGSAHLIVLDLMLPLIDGLHILKKMRREQVNTPVIILTAKGMESERLEGFRAGCDDYVSKPFSLMELIARIRAVLRRSGFKESSSIINSAGLIIDPERRSVIAEDIKIELSPREFDLLYILASHPNQALSREYLLHEVWGEESDVTYRTIDAHVSYIRKKLEENNEAPARIITVYKVGYMWSI
ncbi:MAG: response regulator transcription factor, partial [Calditrichaeota bacterium]|nr:response regulator transcription factor [Calditrichota bacterium]